MKLSLLLALLGAFTLAHGQSRPIVAGADYPVKPVRLLVPFPPGAATDALARLLGQKLSDRWGQPVVVDNRPGAGGIVGTDAVAKAAPDGYTLLMASTSFAINATLYRKLPYDPMRDFSAVSLAAALPNALVVNPVVAAKSMKEFVALAKAQPGQLNYASGGSGSAAHLAMELLKTTAGIDLVHIPYKGGGQALTDLLGGRINASFYSVFSVLPYVKAGRLRALGVANARRSATVPDWPTIAESGVPGFEFTAWYGVLTRAGTPRAIIERIGRDIGAVVRLPEVVDTLSSQGVDLVGNTPEQFSSLLAAEIPKWGKVVRQSGAQAD